MHSTPSASTSPAIHAEPSVHTSRKRRKLNAGKNSIYLIPEIKPYALSIKPKSRDGPTWTTSHAPQLESDSEPEPDLESLQGKEKRARAVRSASRQVGKQVDGAEGDTNENKIKASYRARALKAWETKRQRQKERFEALEAGLSTQLGNSRATSMLDGDDVTAGLDPLLSLDMSRLPEDLPKDDLLNSIHAYAARYYADRGLLLPSPAQIRTNPRPRRRVSRIRDPSPPVSSRESTPAAVSAPAAVEGGSPDPLTLPLGDIPGMDDSGSEYDETDPPGDPEASPSDNEDGDSQDETGVIGGPRKRGGQPGKRKVKDMYLSMDGSGLLAFGVLLQEQIIAHLRKEGYVPASSLESEVEHEDEDEEDMEQTTSAANRTFEVSDDESEEEERESEEGS